MDGSVRLAWARADARTRLEHLLILGGLLLWLTYTRYFWSLHSIHATLPACPFLSLTGHPCPLCGGTRAYAAMWQGDIAAAARYHPLGPLLFLMTLAATVILALGAVSGRRLHVVAPLSTEKRFYLAVGAAFGLSWTLKLLWLGN